MKPIMVILLSAILFSCSQPSFNEKFSGEWVSPEGNEFATLTRALAINQTGNCGSLYVKKSKVDDGQNQYLVACSSDFENWDYYIVNPDIESVRTIAELYDPTGLVVPPPQIK